MANDAGNVAVFANGLVAVAPEGSTLPTDATTALDAAFKEVGYIDEDGVTFTPSINVEGVPAWQALQDVRTILNEYGIEIDFTMLEWSETTLELGFGGGQFTDNLDGTYDFLLPAPGEREIMALVLEGHDGTKRYRLVLDRTELTGAGDITFSGEDAAKLPVTLSALAGLTDGRPGAIYVSTN